MRLTVQYFAVLRERRGLDVETVDVPTVTARELVDRLVAEHDLGLPSSLIRIAVDGRFVLDNVELRDGQAIVLIPPVAGG